MRYISINRDEVPYKFEMELAGEVFGFLIEYNYDFDFFTVDLTRAGFGTITGEKIVYGRPLFGAYAETWLPKVKIVPRDPSGQQTRVGWDQLEETVFLMIEGEADE